MTPRRDWLSAPRRASPLVGLALALTGCPTSEPGPEGPEGPAGGQGDPGLQGPAGADGTAWLVDATPFDRGSAECPYGGVRYDAGLDDGSNGGVAGDQVLQPGEIDHTDTICYPAGTTGDFEPPDGALGDGLIDLSGGHSSALGFGGRGGFINVLLQGTGGHVTAYQTGIVDDAMPVPSSDQAEFGPEPYVVPAGTEFAPVVLAPAAIPTEGQIFQIADSSGVDTGLWRRRSGLNVRITGIHVPPGSTLRLSRDSASVFIAALSVQYDLVNEGTITTTPVGQDRPHLVLGARHYFGGSSSRITLSGLPGTASLAGGQGGDLALIGADSAYNDISPYATGATTRDTCAVETSPGGIVNRGVIDVSPGDIGTIEVLASRNGPLINLCGSDDMYLIGAAVSRGVGSTPEGNNVGVGGRVLLRGMTTVHAGAIDVRGGVATLTAANGGDVSMTGDTLVVSGSIDASGRDVPITTDCRVETCRGGAGGTVSLSAGWGGARVTGPMDLHGGDGFGQVGLSSYGGNAGAVMIASQATGNPLAETLFQPGPIQVSSDFDLYGGGGSGTAGEGGAIDVSLIYDGATGAPLGQGIQFVGYEAFILDGGDGGEGGNGGILFFTNGTGTFTGGEGTGPGGAAVNYVPVSLTGGDGDERGGAGGFYQMAARMPYPSSHAVALTRAPVDNSGGDGGDFGGPGAFAITDAAGYAEIGASMTSRGGNGGTFGGEGGLIAVRSAFDVATMLGPVQVSGGDGYDGGAGGVFFLFAPEANSAGDVIALGGAGDASGGYGGEGGRIDIWSSDTWSVVTGDLTATPGSGRTPGAPGMVRIDGFFQP